MTTPTPPADDQPGSVEVSERDGEITERILHLLHSSGALRHESEVYGRHNQIVEIVAAYRREIERCMRDTSRPG